MTKGKSVPSKIITDNGNEFINSAGKKFILQGLPPLLLPQISSGVEMPKKPTYTVTTVSGDTEVHEHDEKSAQESPESMAAWSEYIRAQSEAEQEISNRMLNCILIEGIAIPDDTDLSRWEKRRMLMGLPIPEDFEEKILEYKRSEVIRSTDDIQKIMSMVMALTGVSEEAVRKAKESFPDFVEPES